MSVVSFLTRTVEHGPLAGLSTSGACDIVRVVQLIGNRRRLEIVVEGLIALFDYEDGDVDFEQTATETFGRGFAADPDADDAEV